MPILIDGNNLLHRLPRGARDREGVRRLILEQTRGERVSVLILFDGFAGPGAPPREYLGQVTLEYSGPATADDTIIKRIPHGSPAQNWVVVTDDQDLARRSRDRGASVRSLSAWLGRRGARRQSRGRPTARALNRNEVAEWEQFFAAGRDED